MALSKTLTTKQNVEVSNAYIKILNYFIDNNSKNKCVLLVGIYLSNSSRNANGAPIEQTTIVSPYDANGDLQAGYNYLKTLDRFSGASDV